MIFVFLCPCSRKKQHETGILLAKYGIREVFGTDAEILYRDNGKPYTDRAGICVSISHTDGLCLAAVSERELGADAEFMGERDTERIAARFFTPEEALYASRSAESFYEVWTAKESFIKYTGEGLSRPLTSFSVLDGGYFFRHFSREGCMISLCSDREFDYTCTYVQPDILSREMQ